MKFSQALALGLLLLSTPAFAQKSSDNLSNNLTSLNYYPHLGAFELNSHALTTIEDKTQNSVGAIAKDGYNQFYGSMIYGIADRLRMALSETLLWDQIDDATSSTSTETLTSSSGLSNPTISTAWRYMEDSSSGFSGDMTLEITPSFGPRVAGNGAISKTGNNLSGGWTEEVSTSLFWHSKLNQIELNIAATNNAPSSNDNASGGVGHTTDYVNSSATLTDRYHLNGRHFLQIGMEFFPGSHRSTTTAAGVVTATNDLSSENTSLLYGFSPDPGIVLEISANWHPSTSKTTSAGTETTTQARLMTTTVALLHNF